jgi:RNA polymerase sigma-70 factor, ECF subfamily
VKNTEINKTEARLVEAAFNGDNEAFESLVKMHQKSVYSMCWRYLKTQEAQDLAQEVFIKVFLNQKKFIKDQPLLPWLLKIARNHCLDYLRKKQLKTLPLTFFEINNKSEEKNTCAETQLIDQQRTQQLEKKINLLPEGQREAVVLYHLEGLSYKEAAQVLSVPEGTVMTWLHRGRKNLQTALKNI